MVWGLLRDAPGSLDSFAPPLPEPLRGRLRSIVLTVSQATPAEDIAVYLKNRDEGVVISRVKDWEEGKKYLTVDGEVGRTIMVVGQRALITSKGSPLWTGTPEWDMAILGRVIATFAVEE